MQVDRIKRLYPTRDVHDHDWTAADRDRVLYSPAFRRLAGVTQVVDPNEGQVFHNRLTHSLRVGGIARRIAERFKALQPTEASAVGGVDPFVAEAAGLAHDLGTPPYGHIAESMLDEMVRLDDADGFEGNAQTFRIVTKLSIRSMDHLGLNLTSRTLNAILKYPWTRETSGKRWRKFGVYRLEQRDFEFARSLEPCDSRLSVEAEIMNWADDIAYAVHDLNDFYRIGLIPMERLSSAHDSEERENFLNETAQRWAREQINEGIGRAEVKDILDNLCCVLPFSGRYSGRRQQDARLRDIDSFLTGRYLTSLKLDPDGENDRIAIERPLRTEVIVLKEIVRHYVVESQQLGSQQYGKSQRIKFLFTAYLDAIKSGKWRSVLPHRLREQLDELYETEEELKPPISRLVADFISSLTDQEAYCMYLRLAGIDSGRVTDRIIV